MSTIKVNTVFPVTSGSSLTLQGNSGGSGVTGLTIDSSGNISGNSRTLNTLTLGTAVTFPTGHVLAHRTLFTDRKRDSSISISSTSYANTGVAGTYTPIAASSASWLRVSCWNSMINLNNASYETQSTCCMTTSSNTTYAEANSIGTPDGFDHYIRTNDTSFYSPYSMNWYFKAASGDGAEACTPSGLTSFSAGTTYYFRVFAKVANASLTAAWSHTQSAIIFEISEIRL